jgi:hypothetical protein
MRAFKLYFKVMRGSLATILTYIGIFVVIANFVINAQLPSKEARDKIVSGDWDVFTGPLVDITGKVVVAEGETFIEPQSAPSWGYVLEGITVPPEVLEG